jgi:hypothetical protein
MKFYQVVTIQALAASICVACGPQGPPPQAAKPPGSLAAAGAAAVDLRARIVADFSSGKVTLMGTVPTDKIRQRVLDKARQLYGAAHVADQLAVDAKVIDAPWLSTDAVLLPLVDNTISDGQSAFDGDKLTLTGEIPSGIMRTQIIERVSKAAGSGVKIENHLQASQ